MSSNNTILLVEAFEKFTDILVKALVARQNLPTALSSSIPFLFLIFFALPIPGSNNLAELNQYKQNWKLNKKV